MFESRCVMFQSWGAKVRAVHIAGAYWAPGFANYLILLQVWWRFNVNKVDYCATGFVNYTILRVLINMWFIREGIQFSKLHNVFENRRLISLLTTWHTVLAEKTQKLLKSCSISSSGHFKSTKMKNVHLFQISRLVEGAADGNPTLKEVTKTLWGGRLTKYGTLGIICKNPGQYWIIFACAWSEIIFICTWLFVR